MRGRPTRQTFFYLVDDLLISTLGDSRVKEGHIKVFTKIISDRVTDNSFNIILLLSINILLSEYFGLGSINPGLGTSTESIKGRIDYSRLLTGHLR